MGKGMKAGKKKNPTKVNITAKQLADAQKATEEDYIQRIEEAKIKAETESTKFMKSIIFLALLDEFKFTTSDIGKLNDAMDKIVARFEGDYYTENLYEDLAKYGIGVDGVEYDEDGKVVRCD